MSMCIRVLFDNMKLDRLSRVLTLSMELDKVSVLFDRLISLSLELLDMRIRGMRRFGC